MFAECLNSAINDITTYLSIGETQREECVRTQSYRGRAAVTDRTWRALWVARQIFLQFMGASFYRGYKVLADRILKVIYIHDNASKAEYSKILSSEFINDWQHLMPNVGCRQ